MMEILCEDCGDGYPGEDGSSFSDKQLVTCPECNKKGVIVADTTYNRESYFNRHEDSSYIEWSNDDNRK